MSAHTPGPWTVGGGTGRLNQIAIDPAIGCAYGAGEEVVANARLIAAAPTMYDYIASSASNGCAEASKIMEAINAGR
jgi:hypothetical protein